MLAAIDQAAAAGFELVGFTGGEATLARDRLISGMKRASDQGMRVRLVTNAWWATSPASAQIELRAYVEAGLSEINFSTGDQHVRFVPLDYVIAATRAAVDAGLIVAIMVETMEPRRLTKATIEGHPEFVRVRADYPGAYVAIHESPWMPLSTEPIYQYADGQAITRANLATRTGCDSVLTTLTVQANARLGACCGLGMRLIPELDVGSIHDTSLAEAARRAEDDFLKQWIAVEGPEKILAWAATIDDRIEWEGMYAHRCQACLRIYKDPAVRNVIAEHHQEKIADVVFGRWLVDQYDGGESFRPIQDPHRD